MRWWQKAAASVLVAIWLPVTWCCLLESAGVVPGDLICRDSCEDKGRPVSGSGDACAALESATYRTNDQQPLVLQPVFADLISFTAAILIQPVPTGAIARRPSAADPGFPTSWQFLLRTALPPRPPSVVA